MMDELHVEWNEGKGKMLVNLNGFFPCSKDKFKRLLKVIALDWRHEKELKENLKNYFQERIPKLPLEAAAKKKEAAECREKAKAAKAALTAEKKRIRNGGKPPYLEWQYDTDYENNKYDAQEAEREAKTLLKSKKQFEGFIVMLERGK